MTRRDLATELASLRLRLGARAVGLWRLAVDHLEQVGFDAAPDMPRDVAEGFARATRSVRLDRVELGIVAATVSGRPRVSEADELPEDVGSGYWLRAFAASRSIAVPIMDSSGNVIGLVSVAMAKASDPTVESVVETLTVAANEWLDSLRWTT